MTKSVAEKDRVKGKKRRKKNKPKSQKKPHPHPSKKASTTTSSTTSTPSTSSSSSSTPNKEASTSTAALSLASRLKKQRGTAATTALPPEWSRIGSLSLVDPSSSSKLPKFLSPNKDGDNFINCMEECYRGFKYEQPDDLPSIIHEQFTSSFHAMNDSGLFLYDVVQPGGKRLSLTFVTRTLVGNPGSTYKYLGLRLFSHPWCDVDDSGDGTVDAMGRDDGTGKSLRKMGYSSKCTKALITMGIINQHLTERTNDVLREDIAPHIKNGLVGSAEYSLTLINRMEPTSVKKDLKKDNLHDMGKTSVSWHKDSGLQDFSSIAVYHTMQDLRNDDTSSSSSPSPSPWKVALRVADAKSRTPALSVPLPSGSLYYLLDDFNHQHEHAVISGASTLRYSSTHRVARDGCGSWQYIRDKCKMILSSNLCTCVLRINNDNASNGGTGEQQRKALNEAYGNTTKRKQLVKEFRACLHLMVELEFEWIRQWHIQGKHHAKLHKYWHKPVQSMIHSYQSLDKVVSCIMSHILRQSSSKSKSTSKSTSKSKTGINTIACEDLYDVAIEIMENVKKMRAAWELRLKDSIFATLPDDMKPFSCPSLYECEKTQIHPKDIRKWRGLFVRLKEEESSDSVGDVKGKKSSSSKKRKLKDNKSNLTKKERKKIASNWEKMKGKI